MGVTFKSLVLLFIFFVPLYCNATDDLGIEISQKIIAAPLKNTSVIDGSGLEGSYISESSREELGNVKGASSRVSVSTVALFTLAMAAATGLGAIPFFFVELDSQWEGICNGMAAGVMLAASFDLIQEGRDHGDSGSLVVTGILAGAIFIWLCKKVMIMFEILFFVYCLCDTLFFFFCSIS